MDSPYSGFSHGRLSVGQVPPVTILNERIVSSLTDKTLYPFDVFRCDSPANFHIRPYCGSTLIRSTANYPQLTEWNVRDSDGPVVFSITPVLSGGSKKTVSFAQKHGKAVIHISRAATADPAAALLEFVRSHGIRILNVAGPRVSKAPEVGGFTREILNALLLSMLR